MHDSDTPQSSDYAPAPHTPPAARNTAVVVLSLILAIDTLLIFMLGGVSAYLWGQQRALQDESVMVDEVLYGAPFEGDEEMWILSDELAMDVSALILDGDMDAYLRLYDADDPHVDFSAVEEEFLEISDKAQESEGVEFMPDMMPMQYEDEETGETLLRITVSGMNFYTGQPAGGRLTLYALYDNGATGLTGREGRDLSLTQSGW